MIYRRYVIADSDGEDLHGVYPCVSHLWENQDGTSMFMVECHDDMFSHLVYNPACIVLPALDAPAVRHTQLVSDGFSRYGIDSTSGDTTLNMLRKLRDKKGAGHVLIDSPY